MSFGGIAGTILITSMTITTTRHMKQGIFFLKLFFCLSIVSVYHHQPKLLGNMSACWHLNLCWKVGIVSSNFCKQGHQQGQLHHPLISSFWHIRHNREIFNLLRLLFTHLFLLRHLTQKLESMPHCFSRVLIIPTSSVVINMTFNTIIKSNGTMTTSLFLSRFCHETIASHIYRKVSFCG